MARYTKATNRLSRREGVDLGHKTVGTKSHASLLRRLNIPPGQHGVKMHRRSSNYGVQLREKQKARRIYGVLEKQFRTYFEEAMRIRGKTGEALLALLERRLDNVVYRLALAPTRPAARQLVGHRHILVNDKIVNIPSYRVNENDIIAIKEKSLTVPQVAKMIAEKNTLIPKWLERKASIGKIKQAPDRQDIDVSIDEQLIVEYYSR